MGKNGVLAGFHTDRMEKVFQGEKVNKICAFLALSLLLTLGCSAPLDQKSEELTGHVSLKISQQGRTLSPGTNLSLGSLEIVFSQGSTQITRTNTPGEALNVSLNSGTWTIQVDGYNTDAVPLLVAQGSSSVEILPGQTSEAQITLVSRAGTGTLSLTTQFAGLNLSSPQVKGTLVSRTGDLTIPLTFETSPGSATSLTAGVPSGYYMLTVQLFDGLTLKGTGVETVRILTEQITLGTINLTPGDIATGNVVLTIQLSLGFPSTILISGLNAQIRLGTTPTVIATSPETQDSWTWYLDGVKVEGIATASYSLPATLSLGTHRLDALGKKGEVVSSGYQVFQVVEAPLPAEVSASPAGGEFEGESVSVTLTAANPASGEYRLDGGSWIGFTSGRILTIALPILPASVTLELKNAEATASHNYKRKPVVETGFALYYYSTAGAPYIWAWEGGTGGREIMTLDGFNWTTNHPQMTLEGDNWYKWSVPGKYLPLTGALNFKINKVDPVITRTATGWFDGTIWKDTDPRTLTATLSPAGGSLSGDTQVSVNVSGPGSEVAVVSASLEGSPLVVTNRKFTLPASSWPQGVNKSVTVSVVSGAKSISIPTQYTYNPVIITADPMNLRIYQVMVESYQDGDSTRDYNTGYGPSNHKGDIRGIINALPYIQALGVNALWLTPIFNSDGSGALDATGYFCKDYFSVDPKFGSLADAQELVNKAHDAGLYVFFDGVFGHHKGSVVPSPSGKTPQGGSNPVDYTNPQTLEFYKEVATYWINTLGIDGWRLDQAYQVPINSWEQIRLAVETASSARKAAGEVWGTLGYMVGEIWKGESEIASQGYGSTNQGLKSNFDFPFRYRILQTLATQEESSQAGAYNQPASNLGGGYTSHNAYPTGAMPNLMLTNHDLVRFGDLIQRAPNLGYGTENADYWKRHKLALGLMASYSGPITLYYGDEYGAEVGGFINKGDGGFYDDHVSRDNGKTTGFNGNEQDLITFVKTLLSLRGQNESLWKGTRTNILSTSTLYADKKEGNGTDFVVVLNTSTSVQSAVLNSVGGTGLTDAITGESISGSGSYTVSMPALGCRLLKIN